MSDREQFFHWAMDNGYMLETLQDNHNTFEFEDTRNAWSGWQASSQVAQDKITALESNIKQLDIEFDQRDDARIRQITALEAEVKLARSNESHADDQRIKCIRHYKAGITALEARCKDLESALNGLLEHESNFSSNKGDCDCNFKSRELSIKYETSRCPHQLARKALSTKSPQDALDRFENEVISRFRKEMARTSRMTYKSSKEK